MVLQAEHTEQPDMQGMFLLLHLLTRVAFKLDASYSFIVASCVIEYQAWRSRPLEKSLYGCSPLEPRVRVDLIGQDGESEVSEILLMADPRGFASSRVWVHSDIASIRMWVYGMVIHHSW